MRSIRVSSPGRINLIGEHTDYNDGFVLPAAIQKAAIVSLETRDDNLVQMIALDMGDDLIIPIDKIAKQNKDWANYLIGVIAQFQKKFSFPTGFTIQLQSNVPIGAGLSSSAAIECALSFAINEIFEFGLTKMELALLAQKAEHEFAGVQCGIMDQFASLFGKKDQVVLLDCQNLSYQYFPLSLGEYEIVLLDTQVKHALASSEYNTRRAECEKAVAMIQEKYAHVTSLRQATIAMLEASVDISVFPKVYNRASYVIQEIERTIAATQDLQARNLMAFGQKMFATHEGLSNLYEVSCAELDLLIKLVSTNEKVLGARMMGGGFGGCTINLVHKTATENLVKLVSQQYEEATGKKLLHYLVSIEEGAHIL